MNNVVLPQQEILNEENKMIHDASKEHTPLSSSHIVVINNISKKKLVILE